ncbi:MAG: hypothetical protein ABEJ92_06955 [Halobacteriales archaeon]
MAPDDAVRFSIEAADGSTDSFEVPAALLDRLAEGDEPAARVAVDIALMGFTGQAHSLVHHAEGEPDAALDAAEEALLDAFEERFGVTYAEATGHGH